MSKILYFEYPTQVRFWSCEDEDYLGGIAYRDEVICGHCGMALPIEELYEDAEETRVEGEIAVPAEDDVIQQLKWVPISDEITGGDPTETIATSPLSH